MGEISDDFAFWQERSHILRTWQKEASTLETPGNSSPTAAGRPALAKLVQLVLQLQTLWVMGFWRPDFFKSTSSRLPLRDHTRCDWVEFPRKYS